MKRICFAFAIVLLAIFSASAQTIGIGTLTPDTSAQLDVYNTTKGLLIPRLELVSTNSTQPVGNPATGLLVYNTATAGTSPDNVIPGFYYWNGVRWYPVVNKGNAPGDMQYWDGTKWINIPIGPNGSVLTVCNGIPTWGPCVVSPITLPADSIFQGVIDSYYANSWDNNPYQTDMAAWTNGGNPQNRRVLMKFDYSSIPANAVIDSARLYLYTVVNPQNGNIIDANFGSSNAGFVQRITSNWTVFNQYSWNNPPTATSTNEAVIPQSTSSTSNVEVVVTDLVRDMRSFGNNGFYIRLQNEVTYNIRQWSHTRNADTARRPKLIVWYHL